MDHPHLKPLEPIRYRRRKEKILLFLLFIEFAGLVLSIEIANYINISRDVLRISEIVFGGLYFATFIYCIGYSIKRNSMVRRIHEKRRSGELTNDEFERLLGNRE